LMSSSLKASAFALLAAPLSCQHQPEITALALMELERQVSDLVMHAVMRLTDGNPSRRCRCQPSDRARRHCCNLPICRPAILDDHEEDELTRIVGFVVSAWGRDPCLTHLAQEVGPNADQPREITGCHTSLERLLPVARAQSDIIVAWRRCSLAGRMNEHAIHAACSRRFAAQPSPISRSELLLYARWNSSRYCSNPLS